MCLETGVRMLVVAMWGAGVRGAEGRHLAEFIRLQWSASCGGLGRGEREVPLITANDPEG